MIYDPEANIICWQIAKGKISHVHEVGNLIIHVSAGNKPLLIEVLDASKFVAQFNNLKKLKKANPPLTPNC